MPSTLNEHTQFTGTDGKPLASGKIYIGTAGADPVASPILIYSDRELTVAIANPQDLDANGRSTNKIWVHGKYSIQVDDVADVQQFQDLDAGGSSTDVTSLIVSNVTGSTTITGATNQSLTAYVPNQRYTFETVGVNTGSVFLNIDDVGSLVVVKNNDKTILPGDFQSAQVVDVIYNETNNNFEWANQNLTTTTFYKGADVVAASSTDIWSQDGNTIHITGSTTIDDFGTAPNVGARRTLIFDAAPTVSHGASLIVLPGGVDYVARAGDVFEVFAESLTQHQVRVTRAISTDLVGAPITTTSGTEHDIPIPSGANKIDVMFSLVSLSGTDQLTMLLGDSGGIQVTGYSSVAANLAGYGTETTFMRLTRSIIGASATGGIIMLRRMDGNTWSMISILNRVSESFWSSAEVTLSGELTTVRIEPNGANTFDGGMINSIIS